MADQPGPGPDSPVPPGPRSSPDAGGGDEVEGEAVELEPTPIERRGGEGLLDGLVVATGRALEPVARTGWRGARGLARGLGVDRALSRAFNRGVDRALESEVVERAAVKVLDSELVDRVWQRTLESDEAQQLVERVAEAPEVRNAIASQGVGMLEDVGGAIGRATRRLDGALERIAHTVLRRPKRTVVAVNGGIATRGLALLLDAALVNGSLLLLSAAFTALLSLAIPGESSVSTGYVAVGFTLWATVAAVYLVLFWTTSGRTPGMAFLGLRIVPVDGERITIRRGFRRLIWMLIAALPLMLGYVGLLLDEHRRGWPDRRAGTEVLYADPDLDWSDDDETPHPVTPHGSARAGRPSA